MYQPWQRVLAALLVLVPAFTAAWWWLSPELRLLALPLAVLAAALLWWGMGHAQPGLFTCMTLGALQLGAAGFALGFFGPLLLMPEANQGPLLGLFISGPLGVLCGLLAGALRWWRQRPRH